MSCSTQHIADRIKEALTKPLPGNDVHRTMMPPYRKLNNKQLPQSAKQSSILILIYPDNDSLYTCFIKRPDSMKHHGGQVAFPGGRKEQGDNSPIETALRESYEEIGIVRENIEILGKLTSIYVGVSNFYICPVVGWYGKKPEFKINTHEVSGLITLKIDELNSSPIKSRRVKARSGIKKVPCYFLNNITIWGATAMILSEFLYIYNKIITDTGKTLT